MNFLLPVDATEDDHAGDEDSGVASEVEKNEWCGAMMSDSVTFQVKDIEE